MEVKPAMSRAFKIKSGKSNYQTRGIASVVSSDPVNIHNSALLLVGGRGCMWMITMVLNF